MNVIVTVTLKNGVLDPQGKAVEHALHSLGYNGAQDVRIGKQIELNLPDDTSDDDLRHICEKLLANTVIEDYTIQK